MLQIRGYMRYQAKEKLLTQNGKQKPSAFFQITTKIKKFPLTTHKTPFQIFIHKKQRHNSNRKANFQSHINKIANKQI